MNIESRIRALAKSHYWQRLFQGTKDYNGICLFENTNNLSGLQISFLYWLEIYNILYQELAHREWDILDEQVIKDDVRCDAFLYWRFKQQQKEILKYKETAKQSKSGSKAKSNQRSFKIYSGSAKGE